MYTSTWKKYLPVIRLLLKKSALADQVLGLNRIDFEKTNRLRKPVISFSMELVRGKFNTLNQPIVAKDLVEVFSLDDMTRTLIRQHHYTISLSADFILTIKNKVLTDAATPDLDAASSSENA